MAGSMKLNLAETETQLRLGPLQCVKKGVDGKDESFGENKVRNGLGDEGIKRDDDWNGLSLSIGLCSHSGKDELSAEDKSSSLSRASVAMETAPKTGSKRVFSDLSTIDDAVNSKLPSSSVGCETREAKHHRAPSAYEWSTSASHFPGPFQMNVAKTWDPADLDPPAPLRQAFLKADFKDQCGNTFLQRKLSVLHKIPPSGSDVHHTKVEPADDAAPRGPVGWPPVQSFRKNSLPPPKLKVEIDVEPAAMISPKMHPTQAESLYVKVYMDGLSIGRKVDLKSYGGYEDLCRGLNELFRCFKDGQTCTKGPRASDIEVTLMPASKPFSFDNDYVLTYEDKDGDLMLVGDVPWGMFMATAKRLRIMKGSEAMGCRKYLVTT